MPLNHKVNVNVLFKYPIMHDGMQALLIVVCKKGKVQDVPDKTGMSQVRISKSFQKNISFSLEQKYGTQQPLLSGSLQTTLQF